MESKIRVMLSLAPVSCVSKSTSMLMHACLYCLMQMVVVVAVAVVGVVVCIPRQHVSACDGLRFSISNISWSGKRFNIKRLQKASSEAECYCEEAMADLGSGVEGGGGGGAGGGSKDEIESKASTISNELSDSDDALDSDDDDDKNRKHSKRMAKYAHWEEKYGLRIIVYVNTKSGGKAGKSVLTLLKQRIPSNQVHDLFEPMQGVQHTLPQHMVDAENEAQGTAQAAKVIRILSCGGDGTVGWVVSSMEKIELKYTPEIALLPLGTGNDLAKVLRWGRFFDTLQNFRPKHFVKKVFTVRLPAPHDFLNFQR